MVSTRATAHQKEKKSQSGPKAVGSKYNKINQVEIAAKRSEKRSERETKSVPPHTSPPGQIDQSSQELGRKDTIRAKIYNLISHTKKSSTICPSQIPRSLHDENRTAYPDWREMMDEVRDIVWEEVKLGIVQVTQGGVVRPYEEREGLKGPIRVRRGPKWDDREE